MGGQDYGVVWSVPRQSTLCVSTDEQLAEALRVRLGPRLGKVLSIGARRQFELQRVRTKFDAGPGAVVLGSAVRQLHPVAGQALNLALREVALLSDLLAEIDLVRDSSALAFARVAEKFSRQRARDAVGVECLTHGLVDLFGLSGRGAKAARGLGLLAFDAFPGLKSYFMRTTCGLADAQLHSMTARPIADPPSVSFGRHRRGLG